MEDHLLRELKEDMQRDRLRELWEKHASTVLGVCAAIVLGTAGGVAWRSWRESRNQELTSSLLRAETPEAMEKTAEAGTGHTQGDLAQLKRAAAARASGDMHGAAEAYRQVKADPALSALARVLGAHARLDGNMNVPEDNAEAPAAAFSLSYKEAQAWRLYGAGNVAEARARFSALKDEVAAPPSFRARMAEVASYLAPEEKP